MTAVAQIPCSVELIYARDVNGLIGVDNKIPWRLSADMKRFKDMTEGHIVMMGRKTYESIGHPLPNRVNVVITSKNEIVETDNLITHKDPVGFVQRYKNLKASTKRLFIIGGKELIVDLGFKYADYVHVTQIYKSFRPNDTDVVCVPSVPNDIFKIKEQTHIHTGEDLLTYNFITYERRL